MCRNRDLLVTWWYINLGMIVDYRLSFQDQANDILRRVNFALRRLWHYADVTPVLTRKRLLQSLIVLYFLYFHVIYSHASSAGVNRHLNVAFNSCACNTYTVCPDFRAFCLTYYDLCMNMMTAACFKTQSFLFVRSFSASQVLLLYDEFDRASLQYGT
jgi:hypothetical protein